MALSDTRIHQIELLLTLDYLLNHTDEDNPATQQDICRHATEFGLKYDPKATTGNDVRRQRIGDCLKFLSKISNEYSDVVPFVLEQTDSGKYYIEQRNGLAEDQVAKILAAIKNDKYTKDEDVDWLIDRVLGAFSTSEYNRTIIDKEYKRLIKGGKKYDKETIRKINLIEKAYREGKMIMVKHSVADTKKNIEVDYYFWYRVYLMKEYHNKLYAFMLPISQINVDEKIGRLIFFPGYLFEPIEKIDVVNDVEKNILCIDLDDHRDFNKLFIDKCPNLAKKYGTIDGMFETMLIPSGGKACIVSFYFSLGLKDILKRSFEDFFSEDFRYQETNMIAGIENQVQDIVHGMDNWVVVTEEPKKEEKPKYGLSNISVDNKSFKSWLLSDPHGDGKVCIADMINIIKPLSLNEDLARYFSDKLLKRFDCLSNRDKYHLQEALKNSKDELEESSNLVEEELEKAYINKETLFLRGSSYEIGREVRRWYEKNKDRVNGYYLDGGLLKTFFDGSVTLNGLIVNGQLFASNEIDNFASLPNRVIVINDYQLLDDNIKKHLELLCDGYVVDGREENGYKKLTNVRFVCVIKNKE